MAIGISGSNGGVGVLEKSFSNSDFLNRPLEVSYFVNNVCNLECIHCYVGYLNNKNALKETEWLNVFDQLIEMNALTFGNVGKEATLNWPKSKALMNHLQIQRQENNKIRYGLVTNATLWNEKIIDDLATLSPNYIDVSFDGTQALHDSIRGEGFYKKSVSSINLLSKRAPQLLDNIFVSFTLMQPNKDNIDDLISNMQDLGLNNFLVSPYVKTHEDKYDLSMTIEDIENVYRRILDGKIIDFDKRKDLQLLLKSDYDTQKPLIDLFVDTNIIDVNNLLVDEYGVIFNRHHLQNNDSITVNYIPIKETLHRAIRISHDGYVSGCYEMFFPDYQQRTVGNIRENNIREMIIR